MTKRWWCGVAAALATALCLTTVGSASPAADEGKGRPERRGGRRGAALAEYLGLTEPQKDAVRALRERQRADAKTLVEEGRALRQRLREALEAREPDPKAVGEATLAMEAHRKQMRARREAFREQFRGLLDAQQKEKLEAFEAARKVMRPGREGRRRPRPARPERVETPPFEG